MTTSPFPLRRGLWITIEGLPDDLTPRDVERVVRWLRVLPWAETAIEVCPCGRGAAGPGVPCPACGTPIPEREREASERVALENAGLGVAAVDVESIQRAQLRAAHERVGELEVQRAAMVRELEAERETTRQLRAKIERLEDPEGEPGAWGEGSLPAERT